ncbi:signal peptidase I [Chloroflexota bacterium]
MRAFLRDILTTLIIAIILASGIQAALQNFIVDGPSMEFSFQDGQRVLVNKIAYDFRIGNRILYHFRKPERGDIIVFRAPNNEQSDYIKRIIGLPGESVEIKDGTVYIHKEDDKVVPLDEPYVTDKARSPFKGKTIPEDEYFVLGDNRNNSGDSRNGWTLPSENIIGKTWLSIWPPERWGLVANYSFEGE